MDKISTECVVTLKNTLNKTKEIAPNINKYHKTLKNNEKYGIMLIVVVYTFAKR